MHEGRTSSNESVPYVYLQVLSLGPPFDYVLWSPLLFWSWVSLHTPYSFGRSEDIISSFSQVRCVRLWRRGVLNTLNGQQHAKDLHNDLHKYVNVVKMSVLLGWTTRTNLANPEALHTYKLERYWDSKSIFPQLWSLYDIQMISKRKQIIEKPSDWTYAPFTTGIDLDALH